MEINDQKSSPEARAERLKRVRNLANLSRKEMCEGTDLNVNTLKGWEISRFVGLSKSGANKVVTRVAIAGVTCSADWLLYEIGEPPQVNLNVETVSKSTDVNSDSTSNKSTQKEQITQELLLFRTHNPKAVDLIVSDSSMMPYFTEDDVVAGLNIKNLDEVIGQYAIVTLENGKKLLRSVRKGEADNTFTLLANNLEANADHLILSNISLKAAAPVIWHRKTLPESH